MTAVVLTKTAAQVDDYIHNLDVNITTFQAQLIADNDTRIDGLMGVSMAAKTEFKLIEKMILLGRLRQQ